MLSDHRPKRISSQPAYTLPSPPVSPFSLRFPQTISARSVNTGSAHEQHFFSTLQRTYQTDMQYLCRAICFTNHRAIDIFRPIAAFLGHTLTLEHRISSAEPSSSAHCHAPVKVANRGKPELPPYSSFAVGHKKRVVSCPISRPVHICLQASPGSARDYTSSFQALLSSSTFNKCASGPLAVGHPQFIFKSNSMAPSDLQCIRDFL